ncbi:chorismate synthase [Paenibacillus radicis (ex Xue et al. 2023)]|uniref:Chorismate synthase n=1 Tax=Paenibacillus radicis (ex Xue et al. 2023) TaxID=2972489 RepID=A0ABT1YJC7_9BACL|nr:chorismate synthase [Paenibacillus radicis (ex Xue et al. 2023)]MCR8633271.1 chorismate synthase [Paenibacillus radicis (ex Xue et al. 2023)]
MRYLTAGESHGPQLTAIIEGMPSNIGLIAEQIDIELQRRQKGYGRGRRMEIESDQVRIVGGVRHGKTTGAPIALVVENRDWNHWSQIMGVEPTEEAVKRAVTRPRPGHADLNGGLKYNQSDLRNILERSSARETTIRVACGAAAKSLLQLFGIHIGSQVLRIGEVSAKRASLSAKELRQVTEVSPLRTADKDIEAAMMQHIDEVKAAGDSVGGLIEVTTDGVPVGLGSHVQWDRKLDGKIAQAVMSIQAFKGCEFGVGFEAARLRGSKVHDEIMYDSQSGFSRASNRAGGFEGGMTTGEPIIVRAVMKPIPTLYKPISSVDIETKQPYAAQIERSDSCAVPAAAVVMENVVAWELACAFLEKFGGDSYEEIERNYKHYIQQVRSY